MYTLLDSGNFQKLERLGSFTLVRPSPQAVWRPALSSKTWEQVDAVYTRFSGGDGEWKIKNSKLKQPWVIKINTLISVNVRLTDFGHLGIFPEQDKNWNTLSNIISQTSTTNKTQFKVLNLFAYTGISTLFCAQAGAQVVHIDASKTSVSWAKDNAIISKLDDKPIRWIVEDVKKFVTREIKRNNKYNGIILDPPSYGRGPNGEVWKIESDLPLLLDDLKLLLADDFAFLLLSAHSSGYSPISLQNLIQEITFDTTGEYTTEEMVVPTQDKTRLLPSGASCLFVNKRR